MKALTKITAILLVTITVILCIIYPELPYTQAQPLFLSAYAVLLFLSVLTKSGSSGRVLCTCAAALVLSVIAWNFFVLGGADTLAAMQDGGMVFSQFGVSGYVILACVLPVSFILIGDEIRKHRAVMATS